VQVSFVTYGDGSDLRYADRIPGIRILCNRWGLPPRRYERWLPLLHGWHLWRADVCNAPLLCRCRVACGWHGASQFVRVIAG